MVAIPGMETLLGLIIAVKHEPELPAELRRAEPSVALAYARCAAERRRVYRAENTETLEEYREKLEDYLGWPDRWGSREYGEIHDDLQRRMVWSANSELAFFGAWIPYFPPPSIARLDRGSLQALGNEELLRARDREDRIRARLARRAAKKLRGIVGDTADGRSVRRVLDGEIGQRWINESCASDPEMVGTAHRIAYPEQPPVLGDDPSPDKK